MVERSIYGMKAIASGSFNERSVVVDTIINGISSLLYRFFCCNEIRDIE